MRRSGLDVAVEPVAEGRPNVIGVVEGRTKGRTLMFCGHTDTVGVVGMTDPFTPVEREGRLYGRGAQDMKGGVAAMMSAAAHVAQNGGLASGRLIVAAVVDEEHSSIGADALVKKWTADAAIVTEPTDLAIAVGHKGFAWVGVTVEGKAAHGSRPAEGQDAILRLGRVLDPSRSARCDAAGAAAAPAGRHRLAARVDHRRRPRAQQLSRSRDAADGAPHPAERTGVDRDRRGAGDPRRAPARGRDISGYRGRDVQPARLRSAGRPRAAAGRSRKP